ncbi:hypothetical protein BpHYR1_032590 [Brachionus plicatilis]|uniref:Uncharacterized protein n=1 Tax=Brachionus plicatilis TaxID=10195 RepID=A0A3M7PRK1_BRAPC|nr:hypothetical protein BpHYR1_032590 [Brachionus plicatilis]
MNGYKKINHFDVNLYIFQKYLYSKIKFNSNLIFIRNATYSNIGSNLHIRFHHYEMESTKILENESM